MASSRHRESRMKLQEEALKMFRANPRLTLQDVSLALGLNHAAVWTWKKNNTDGFADRYQEVVDEAFDSLVLPAVQSLGELVDDNNFQAVKYVLDAKGYAAALKVETNSPIEINVSIEDDSDEG